MQRGSWQVAFSKGEDRPVTSTFPPQRVVVAAYDRSFPLPLPAGSSPSADTETRLSIFGCEVAVSVCENRLESRERDFEFGKGIKEMLQVILDTCHTGVEDWLHPPCVWPKLEIVRIISKRSCRQAYFICVAHLIEIRHRVLIRASSSSTPSVRLSASARSSG